MKELLLKLAAHLRAMQLFYHSAHHHSGGSTFFSDHEAFGDFYSALDGEYDSAVERLIGLFGQDVANLQAILIAMIPKLEACPSNTAKDNASLFSYGLQMEGELIALVEAVCKSPECRESTKQLVSEFGNQSEIRIYKIKQRVRK